MTDHPVPYVLTIDVGTSSTRAILYDASARQVPGCVAQRANRLGTTADGGATFSAQHLLDGVIDVIDRILEQAGPRAAQIGAVAMDTLVGNILGVDAAGQPVTPVFIYADTRNAADAQALRAELGPEAAVSHDRTGCLIHTSYLPARFRWLARERPELLDAATAWIGIGEYVLEQITGVRVASYSTASWSGMLDRRALAWDNEWLARLPVEEAQLSPLGDIDHPVRGLLPSWAKRWPVLRDVAWLPAIGDGAAVNIGSGCDDVNRVALTVGSTGAMRVVVDPDITRVPDGLWLYRVDAGRGLLGGATTEGGNLFGWLRQTLQLPPAEELEAALAARAPDGHGLTVLPFVAGERAPGWRENARASVVGFSLNTDAVDLVKASLESIAYRMALIYARIAPHLGGVDHEIVASGGALLSSPAWVQIMANVLGRPVLTLEESEATSRGLALLALEQLGIIDRPSDLPPATGPTYQPDPERHTIYADAVARQAWLYENLVVGWERQLNEH